MEMDKIELRNYLFKKLCKHFSKDNITQLVFRLGIEEELDNSSNATLIQELVAYLERHLMQHLPKLIELCQESHSFIDWSKIIELCKKLYPSIDWSKVTNTGEIQDSVQIGKSSNHLTAMDDVDEKIQGVAFQNRFDELEEINRPTNQLIVIDAPAGYGKSYLLSEVEKRKKQDGWNCYLIDFRQHNVGTRIQTIRKTIADKIDLSLSQTGDDATDDYKLMQQIAILGKNVIFLLDAVENLCEQQIKWLKEFVIKCYKQISRSKFSVIIAGRYITSGDKVLEWRGFKRITLSAFTEETVQSAINSIDPHCNPDRVIEWAKHITNLSGGHPKGVQKLIAELSRTNFVVDFQLVKQQLFNNYIEPEIDIILSQPSNEFIKELEVLSIFRRVNFNTIEELKKLELIDSSSDTFDIVKRQGLVTLKDTNGFYGDEIIRRLILARLKVFAPMKYADLNKVAQEIYDNWIDKYILKGSGFGDPKILGQFFLRERTYHLIQQLFNKKFTKARLRSSLRDSIKTLAKILGKEAVDEEYKDKLQSFLNDDDIHLILEEYGLPCELDQILDDR